MGVEMIFAYADPPYLGQGKKHYGDHPDAHLWDSLSHYANFVRTLHEDFPEGWMLSCSSSSLSELLPHCDSDVRIGAWVKPFHIFKKGVRPAYAWEPVLFQGGRNRNHPPPPKGGKATTPRDWVSVNITLKKGLIGVKPPEFNDWILDLLNYQLGDELVDLFPGQGGMAEAIARRENDLGDML